MRTIKISIFVTLFQFFFNDILMAQAKITHIAVYIENLERSRNFYREVFGFKEIDEPFKDGLHAWFDIGNNLSMHLIEAPWEPVTINKINHICISVQDMEAFITNLNALGIPFEDWPGNLGEVTTRPDRVKQVYIRDPDGYWIEINDEYN